MSLKELLTNIANAIRNKKGTTELIPAQNFATEISNLPSGDELIGEYEITNSTTTNVVFDNLNIVIGDEYYMVIDYSNTGVSISNMRSLMCGMSVNELKGSDTGGAYSANLPSSPSSMVNSSLRTNYGILGCARGQGKMFISFTAASQFDISHHAERWAVIARFVVTDTVINKITVYAAYDDIDEAFKSGTKIQLYKKPKA